MLKTRACDSPFYMRDKHNTVGRNFERVTGNLCYIHVHCALLCNVLQFSTVEICLYYKDKQTSKFSLMGICDKNFIVIVFNTKINST